MKVILASKSPRRQELLRVLCSDFSIDVPVGEEFCPAEIPLFSRPEFLAREKAIEVAARNPDALIIAADTAVFSDGAMLGKPKNEAEAREMLGSLSGKTHEVITGCAIAYSGKIETFSVKTEVEFYPLSDSDIDSYIKTGESFDKAGAYGIQGKGAILVRGIRGDYFNVVGLPIAELSQKLKNICILN